MAKLNLKALQITSNINEAHNTNECIELTSQENLEHQSKTCENILESIKEDDNSKKKKISLRGISKPIVSDKSIPATKDISSILIEELTPTQEETTAIVVEELTPTQEETTAIVVEELTPTQEETTAIIVEELTPTQEETTAIIVEELTPTQEETTAIVAIMDGDTNCAIIKDDTFEIFGSYKGSFAKEEPKKVIEEERVTHLPITEVTSQELNPINSTNEEVKNENLKTQNNQEETIGSTTYVDNSETTALEKVTQKRKISKKIMYSSLVSVLCIGIFGVIFMNNNLIKTSVPDIKNIPNENIVVENTPIAETTAVENPETIDTTTQENATPTIENTNHIVNNEIVKENNYNIVDNNDNNNKINKKVENYLLKKYKIK